MDDNLVDYQGAKAITVDRLGVEVGCDKTEKRANKIFTPFTS
jgi:hypothetical protein